MEHNDPSRYQYTATGGTAQQEAEQHQQQQHQQEQQRRQQRQQQQQQQQGQQQAAQFQTPRTPSRLSQSSYTNQQQQGLAGPSITRAGSDTSQLYGFAQGMQFVGEPNLSTQYAQEYNQSQPVRSQPQQFVHYESSLGYSATPIHPQQAQHAPYGQFQQYRTRPGGTIETLPNQFQEPQAAQYYAGAQPSQAAVSNAGFGSGQLATHYQSSTYVPAGPAMGTSSYPGAMIESLQQTPYQAYGPQHTALPGPQLQHHLHQVQTEQAFARYQTNIRTIFVHVRNRSLREIPQPLLEASRYLLGGVEALGLTKDEEGQHDDRIVLWDEYNRAWLTAMQCQFDMTQEMISGRDLVATQSTLDYDMLEGLARELVRLCDGLERYGLVDYQMGVAEDEIIEVILRCLSQLDSPSEDAMDTEAV